MTYDIGRRRCVVALGALAASLSSSSGAQSAAPEYPARPISIVLPYSAGTGIDAATRSLAESMQRNLKQPVVVINKVGAGGNIGTETVVHAGADGYTVLVVANTIAINPSLYRNMRYDPERDLAPVGLMLKSAMVLVASSSMPSHDLKTLVELSQKEPDKLDYASSGIGTPQHLAMEMLKSSTRLNARHIPHKGAAEAVMSVAGGQIGLAFVPMQSALALIAKGTLQAVAVSSPQRSPVLPDVPTVAESIGRPFDVDLWYGMFVPVGTPPAIVATLGRQIRLAFTESDLEAKLGTLGMTTALGTPGELASLTKADRERWSGVIRQGNITAE